MPFCAQNDLAHSRKSIKSLVNKEMNDSLGVWDLHVHTAMFKVDHQKGPTYKTGNYVQYSVITYVGKEYEKGMYIYTYIYIYMSHFAKHLKLTHCKPTMCLSFPGGSGSKKSACNAGDPGPISKSGRSPGEGNGCYTPEINTL